MNDTHGPFYAVSRAEAATPELAQARADGLKGQFVMDMHTHFLRDDTRIMTFVRQREAVGKAGWNPGARGQGADDRGPEVRQLLQGDLPRQRHQGRVHQRLVLRGAARLLPHQRDEGRRARERVNKEAGTKRMFSHAIFTPGRDGWLEKVDEEMERLQARFVEGLHDRRQHQQAPGQAPVPPRRREAHVPVLRAAGEVEQGQARPSPTSASTRASSRRRWRSSTRTCSATATSPTSARPRRTGRS